MRSSKRRCEIPGPSGSGPYREGSSGGGSFLNVERRGDPGGRLHRARRGRDSGSGEYRPVPAGGRRPPAEVSLADSDQRFGDVTNTGPRFGGNRGRGDRRRAQFWPSSPAAGPGDRVIPHPHHPAPGSGRKAFGRSGARPNFGARAGFRARFRQRRRVPRPRFRPDFALRLPSARTVPQLGPASADALSRARFLPPVSPAARPAWSPSLRLRALFP